MMRAFIFKNTKGKKHNLPLSFKAGMIKAGSNKLRL